MNAVAKKNRILISSIFMGTLFLGGCLGDNDPESDSVKSMPKGYWIVQVDVADAEKYKAYMAANADPLRKHGAHFLVRGGTFVNAEGKSRSRNAVVEFPTYEAAMECWKSAEYQAAIKLRLPVSTLDLVIIEGYEGPQP
ncbi:MAG TPA: DUF1330 domain-containing protein [Fibrobacteria bacterium]|nr:DUF1330 domain-containing protein [Fibrobacteria bacterium]